jgi:CAAX prenyl protease-like protein
MLTMPLADLRSLRAAFDRWPWLPYVAPFAAFAALTAVEPSHSFIPWLYPLKTVVVAGVILLCARAFPPLKPAATWLAVVVGVVVFVLWVLPEGLVRTLGTPSSVNPFDDLSGAAAWTWIVFRILGATVVVAVMEEVFWRGFLLRWIIHQDFRRVALGAFSWPSFLATSALFAVEHNRWLVGLVAGVAYNLLLYRTRSLYACVVAHGVTNLALGLYVLHTGQWSFW